MEHFRDRTYRFVDTCTRANNVYGPEFRLCHLEHVLELRPVRDVCLLEDCSRGTLTMNINNPLSLGAESEVREEDITTFAQEELGKTEVDTGSRSCHYGCFSLEV